MQYETDWTEWPVAGTLNNLGAPFDDVNHDGTYEPDIDIPGIPGADQTIYFVANDQDSTLTKSLYGTLPMGIELHATYWAYAQAGELGDMYFKKYTLVNKGYQHNTIDSMFVSFWSDPDIGRSSDDLVGSDDNNPPNLIYTYNGELSDALYPQEVPPSIGFALLKGPKVIGQDLNIYASYTTTNPGGSQQTNFSDPDRGQPYGSTQFYNFFKGFDRRGNPIINPITGQSSKFIFNGDPVTSTGWIDGIILPPRDVRQGMSCGPFTFPPGRYQEIIFAEMIGQGSDYLHSIYAVKNKLYYYAVEAYKGNLPSLPVPIFTLSNNNNAIQIQWDNKAETDSLFEGYNVYQLDSTLERKENAKLIATFDKKDGIKEIYGLGIDGQRYSNTAQTQGFRIFLYPLKILLITLHFLKGKTITMQLLHIHIFLEIHIGVIRRAIFNLKQFRLTVVYLVQTYGDTVQVQHIKGQSDAKITATVIDATKLTGHQYSVSFHDEKYIMGPNGMWTDITSPNKKLGKVSDLTGSSLTSNAIWSGQKGKAQIHYLVNVVSPGYDYCDGIILNLPINILIDSIYNPISNNDGSAIPYKYNSITNTIFFGDSSRSTNGLFVGGEDIVLIVFVPTLPLITKYTMFDDDFQGSIKDVNSTDTLNTIANQYVTQHQWNVTDLTAGNTILKNQTIYNNNDIYAPDYYFANYGIYGPGGSSGSRFEYVGTNADSIFDGIRVDVNGSFSYPASIGSEINNINPNSSFDIRDFTAFGYPDATANTTLSLYNGEVTAGTTVLSNLTQDYELKWTGVVGDTTINGHTVVITKSGGSYATIFKAIIMILELTR